MALMMDAKGRIACEWHAPVRGSELWTERGWRPMRLDDRVDFEAEMGHAPVCGACSAQARRDAEGVAPWPN